LVIGNNPEEWDNSRFIPDCIIINLGTNDHSYAKNIPERVGTFGREYYRFLQQVRSKNPSAKILCTLGAMGQDLCDEVERQVCRLKSEGDKEVYFMAFDLQSEKDGLGADWHPTKVTHGKMAAKLERKLREILCW
jgi:hypothetical protein